MTENESDLTSHKGKKKRSCMEVKKQLVFYAEEKSNQSAIYHYVVGP